MLYRIAAKHYVAGSIVEEGIVIDAPPIVRYMVRKPFQWVQNYCKGKNWKIEEILP